MARETILVVEDEEDLLELARYNLVREGYQVIAVGTGEEALEAARTRQPDVVLLDLMLPGINGLDVCRLLKNDARTRHTPVIMVTARGEDADVVLGLELGADDYVIKPFSPRVLVARVRVALRRADNEVEEDGAVLRRGGLVIDPGRHEVTVDGAEVELTHTQFLILQLLARRPGWVFGRQQILETARGDDYLATERSVDVHIVALRRKLGDEGDRIETVRGVGYRFRE
ncbi:MAG: response regulator transcription factor [Armatimonadetes bacterium]|nr:response regulator transcription factor [Armatimonadota bacterium]